MRCTICSLAVLLYLSTLSAATHKHYFVGNSLTDAINYSGFVALCEAKGITLQHERCWTPGAPLTYLWNTTGCRPTASYNSASLQTFDRPLYTVPAWPGAEDGDVLYAGKFADQLRKGNPDIQVYIYAQWVRKTDGDWDENWNKKSSIRSVWFYDSLVETLRVKNPGVKPVCMIPVGHVFNDLHQQMKNNKIPGFNSIYQFYADEHHLNANGAYTIAVTFFATIFKQDPSSLPTAPYGVDAALGREIRSTAWRVVNSIPFAGVNSTSVHREPQPFTPRMPGPALKDMLVYSLTGRCLRRGIHSTGTGRAFYVLQKSPTSLISGVALFTD